ncbi:GNAT superfamily N-acetyltransferase [Amycolatopsis lexingtonensis]|uniref:GNAT superfamily N-acetyltransferase n=1 Tax=Amycolatopsis lexingtonensis TaxID=218822 RepID=A0ABR9I3S5_9PSEU|nr:GNAT family N-acetyltransferase [Amycolatopsis lexingtonensis]MBE1497824.1 GNAT superfamily N-acetyltransferase [Amycolatopsis lexingtonensis]
MASWRAAYAGLLPDGFLAHLSAGEQAATWAERIAGGGRVLVVEEAGAVAGFAAFAPDRLYALYLLPRYWGRGLGRALHDRVLEELSGDAVLWVLATNERAKAFYVRQGWRADGETGTETLGEVTLDVVRFRRPS